MCLTKSGESGKDCKESNRGPSAYQPNALPLGQTGSLSPTLNSPYGLCGRKVTLEEKWPERIAERVTLDAFLRPLLY